MSDTSGYVIVPDVEGDVSAEEVEGELEGRAVIENDDHTVLRNRDKNDQHPMKAITYLEEELAARPGSVLTNTDIQNILNS